MATPTLPQEARAVLKKKGIIIKEIEYLHPKEGVHSLGGHDPRFADTWTKLRFVMITIDRFEISSNTNIAGALICTIMMYERCFSDPVPAFLLITLTTSAWSFSTPT
jgi:hypothetical protein